MFRYLYQKFLFSPQRIKAKNERQLLARGARICHWLPIIDQDTQMRTALDVGRRAAIVCAMYHVYIGVPTKMIRRWLDDNGLMPYVSPEEKILLQKSATDISDHEKCDLSWYVESLYALVWAGSIYDALDVEEYVPETLVNHTPNLQESERADAFIAGLTLRPYSEIYKMLDFYYRASWYARDANLTREDSKNFDLNNVMARRRSLEWVFDADVEWDHVDLST